MDEEGRRLHEEAEREIAAAERDIQDEADFERHRHAFGGKRRRDRMKIQCLQQFGPGGRGVPSKPDPDEPTKMMA